MTPLEKILIGVAFFCGVCAIVFAIMAGTAPFDIDDGEG